MTRLLLFWSVFEKSFCGSGEVSLPKPTSWKPPEQLSRRDNRK